MLETLNNSILSVMIFLPLVGAMVLLLLKRPADEEEVAPGATPAKQSSAAKVVRGWSLFVAFATFVVSLLLLRDFDSSLGGYQFVENCWWLERFRVSYHVGIDGLSLLLVLLTTFLTLLCVLYSLRVGKRIREYMVFLLVLESALLGVFCALDLVLFYVFWEAVLIPMYFLIGIWGHERRIYAAVKFFLYTFVGSVLMLVSMVYVYVHAGTFDMVQLTQVGSTAQLALLSVGPRALMWVYLGFALAFMIKVPMFPFHTWLPDAHVEAPTAGSVMLAGVLLKMGTYGFLRICLPMFPGQARATATVFVTLAVIGIVYGAIVAAMQPDMKKLVAYSSISHLGFVMLGIFSFTPLGITGAMLQNINHGISTGMLFFLVGMMYDRRHTREIVEFGGIKRVLPVLSTFFLIAMLSSIALPLTNGFVGEFTILQGSYLSASSGPAWTVVAAAGMILSAAYMLWLFQRVFVGPVSKEANRHLVDLDRRETWVLLPLAGMIFLLGCFVTPWTNLLSTSVDEVTTRLTGSAVRGRTAVAPPHQVLADREAMR